MRADATDQERLAFQDRILGIASLDEFNAVALEIFQLQAAENPVYREFLQGIQVQPAHITRWQDIPALPISFFKTHTIRTSNRPVVTTFRSSGTTGSATSQLPVVDPALYEAVFNRAFEQQYGPLRNRPVLALLPSYLERGDSSLVYMANAMIEESQHPASGFYLDQLESLSHTLAELEKAETPTLMLGVSFALLDLAERHPVALKYTTVMETGGMKGRKKEMVRGELHQALQNAFGLPAIHSEYGMTELFSQAYSAGNGLFTPPPWMRVVTREVNDPLALTPTGKTGGINIIDLANVDTCSFIATQDLGVSYEDGSFEVLGRFDNSDIRGCNLMVSGQRG